MGGRTVDVLNLSLFCGTSNPGEVFDLSPGSGFVVETTIALAEKTVIK
jgi:hypothetical protein